MNIEKKEELIPCSSIEVAVVEYFDEPVCDRFLEKVATF